MTPDGRQLSARGGFGKREQYERVGIPESARSQLAPAADGGRACPDGGVGVPASGSASRVGSGDAPEQSAGAVTGCSGGFKLHLTGAPGTGPRGTDVGAKVWSGGTAASMVWAAGATHCVGDVARWRVMVWLRAAPEPGAARSRQRDVGDGERRGLVRSRGVAGFRSHSTAQPDLGERGR